MCSDYAGDISPHEAWDILAEDPRSVLVDVRTKAEWSYIGFPDLSGLNKSLIKIEWQIFPEGFRNERFVEDIEAAKIAKDQTVLLICRSGVRSKHAAQLLTAHGWQRCYNVEDGFEGQLDENRHRGLVSGWKVDRLPWVQS